ncbi:Zn-ribbon domain-containing protein [Methanoculleus horonobensis]|jgi:predicted  nucleic acid-binding Zn-ribbon protein|uniref:Zn-ribbon domain-containing protein n=1 Tax=Methanoculleus horonobensis TaxID=528314 RepID=UPI000829F749|nr:Zn-ribbon domain-containing protein [Methanoculleus horonobensis]MDD3071024.1 Zn-ribbon domain-containing protein [Methanoculleus horonobensis]MDD4252359.1 Zn-ribbon domain-containing protein [Methanoculleus horonobensis]
MPHKCTQCGREFEDGSTKILKGCPSCGGKKFLYIREAERHDDVLKEKTIDEIAQETGEEVLEVKQDRRKKEDIEVFERIESIRILGPGSYELNIEKLARSDEVVVGLEKEGKYVVDILSMAKKKK